MTSAGYLRFPHLHDNLIAFVAEDDVWLAPAAGGRAWRVSADQAQASHPRISRDGTMIAWTSGRGGPPEVFLADVEGGDARRLTYWGDPQTRVTGWDPAGAILVVSAAGQPFSQFTWAYAISADGSTDGSDGSGGSGGSGGVRAGPRRLAFGPVSDLSVEPAGVALLTGTMGREPAYWKRYRGGTSGRLWLAAGPAGAPVTDGQDGRGPFARVLAGLPGHFASPMLAGGRLAFLSDHEGTGNVYSCALDGGDLRRHTDHEGFYARNASTDGSRIVYHCAGDIWLLDSLDPASEPTRLELNLGSPAARRARRLISAEDHLGALSCDQTGRASAIEVRGTVHWLTHRDGPARALSVVPGVRARQPHVLGTSGQVVWVTDAEGADALEIGPADGSPDPAGTATARRVAAGAIGRVQSLAAAPDGHAVAVAARDGRLMVVDVASGTVTEITAADNGPVSGLAWSPDSAWLAWSHPGTEPLRRLRIAQPPGPAQPPVPAVADVTDGRFVDTEPVFSTDGRYLAFLSRRSFDPVYDAHFFDLSFPYGCRPYLVPLAAATPSPFGPLSDGRPAVDEQDTDHRDEDHSAAPDDTGQAAAAVPGADSPDDGPAGKQAGGTARVAPVRVDTELMASRVVQVPVPESRYGSLRAVKGGLAWLREPVTGNLGEGGASPADDAPRPVLERFDFAQRRCTELASEIDWFEVSGDGSRLVVCDGGELSVISAEHKPDTDNPADRVRVDRSRARYLADPAALWHAAYEEAGRIMRDDFWVPSMSGVDWDAVLAEYRPLLDRIAGPRDFADLLYEVFGELGTSHAYVLMAGSQGEAADGRPDQVGMLGADLELSADGRWLVSRVIPGESSDPRASSPLAAPGVGVVAGDEILAVDGQRVGAAGPGWLLAGAAGRPVELTISPAGRGRPRRVVVSTLKNDRRLRYQDWVAGRRRLVRELSGGKIGYLHVPDMMSEGWADFHRDLRSQMVSDALIVDVRGNRGGHTSQLVVEKLARRVIGWDVPRGMQPGTYPSDAPRGPVVALANEYAGSDGDIVTAAIKIMRMGPVVGTRTWGGVIGIDGFQELADGTQITVPRYATWLDGYGWGLENYGVDPDVEVIASPEDQAAGRDRQLETAVRLALEGLEARPAAVAPDTSSGASRQRPALPPRPG